MATGVQSWSKTAATNSSADSAVNWAEGQAPSSVNDSARGMMASVAKWRDDQNGTLTTSGSSTAYTVSSNQSFASLAAMDGARLTIKFDQVSGAAPTISVDGLAAKPLQTVAGTAVPSGYFLANSIWDLTYDNSNSAWVVHGALVTGTTGIADNAVTYAKLQDVSATARILGRKTALAGDPEECTLSEVLDFISSAAQGDILYRGASTWARLGAGTLGQVLSSGGAAANLLWGPPGGRLLHVRNEQTSSTDGESIGTSATMTTRVLNTVVTNEIAGASVSSNQITLNAGTYDVDARAPFYLQEPGGGATHAAVSQLYDVTNGAQLIPGSGVFIVISSSVGRVTVDTIVKGRITLSGTTILELRSRSSRVGIGGKATGLGTVEVYSDIQFRRIA